MENNYNVTLHSYKQGNILETTIGESKSGKYTDYELIFIVDRSGSMHRSYPILINKIIPYLLDKLKFPENKPTHFITFEDYVDYRMFTKKDFLECTEPAPGAIEKMTDVFPQLRKIFVPKNQKTPFRILTLSDGELVVEEERRMVPKLASELSEEIKGKFRINSQAIRYFTSEYGQPDTLALASILQLNTVKEATLLDMKCSDSYIESGDRIYELFKNDGFDCDLTLRSNKVCLRSNPWVEPKNEVQLFIGKNFFWVENFDDKTEFKIKINDEEEKKMNIIKGQEINKSNYGIILANKIFEFLNKLKVLKIVNTEKTQKEIEQIIEKFKKFEECLENTEEDIVLKDGKMASRIVYMQKLINKRKGLISNQMDKIKNDNRLSEFNSQQKADYLRSVDDTKLGKNLAKRALTTGEDLNDAVFGEIEEISKNIDELNNIDDSNFPSSFYSTSTTVESLKEISTIVKEPFYKELEVTDVLKLINIVGIACNGKIGEYPDPSVYIVKNIFPGCYISMADIATAEEYSKGNKHLEVPGTKEEINNCIPIIQNEKIAKFLKHSPKIMELLAGIGMRRVLAEIPLTFESLILSGLWKMIGIIKEKKSEINIKCFLDICNTMKYVCGEKYNNVIDVIKEQFKNKDNKNGLYINNYGLFQMLPVLYNCALNKTFNKNELQKIFRAILRFEVYKLIRSRIRKAEKKDDFIKESLNAALGIDFEKYGTKLPPLFEKKVDPEFYDQFHISKDIVKEYLKIIGWTELIPFSYILFSSALDSSMNVIENIKKVKEYKFQDVKEELGINYDFEKFIIFNIVQCFLFKEKIDRENEDEKVMKIIDSNDEKEIDNFLRSQAKHIYASEYAKENQKQIKKQFEIISEELINKIISAKDLSEFNILMKNGITKGYLSHKISSDSSKGYIDLKKKMLDDKIDIPLRYEKLKAILTGKDEKGQDLWNNGNAIRTHKKEYQIFIQKNKPEIWEEISKASIEHKYREKTNRQGHSNLKKSYWAIGYETLQEFYELSKEKDVEDYKKVHNNCCGLGDPKTSLKNLKKIERKRKRKEFRQKKKTTDSKTKKITDGKAGNEKRGRGGRRIYRGRRIRGRGGIKRGSTVKTIHMEVDDKGSEEFEDDEEMEIIDSEKDKINEEERIIGRKKKRTQKKLGKKMKEDKKLERKIRKLSKK